MEDQSEVVGYYQDRYDESARLAEPAGRLELLRTQQIVSRHLGPDITRVADIGGGPGVYAAWLADLGHEVVLVDPVPRHIDEASARRPLGGSLTAMLGDARAVDLDDNWADAILLLGPLYHLLERGERLEALSEARRVLRPEGRLFAAGISRFASVHDGLARGYLFDPEFATIALADLESGRHENPGRHPRWFTSAYFHRPAELAAEVEEAGFMETKVLGVEGLAGWLPDLADRLSRDDESARLCEFLARMESEPSLVGVSAHLLAIATGPN